jgi:hypothetical protein
MPRSQKKILEDKILLIKSQSLRLDEAKNECLRKSRHLLLTAYEAGYSQTYLSKLWNTNPSRMKIILAQAMAEKSDNVSSN